MTHGHEVLRMMEGNSYTREGLVRAIIDKFGAQESFCTCHAEGLTAEELVGFLEGRGKFIPAGHGAFTVDVTKICGLERAKQA